jgi:hypothetical protein
MAIANRKPFHSLCPGYRSEERNFGGACSDKGVQNIHRSFWDEFYDKIRYDPENDMHRPAADRVRSPGMPDGAREPADTRKIEFLSPFPACPGDSNSRARRFTGRAPDGARRTLPEEHSDPEDSRLPGAILEDMLGEIWSSVVALILYPVVFFAVAYTRFLRTDIR